MWCASGGALRSAAIGLTFALVGCSGGGGKADGTLPTAPPTSVAATTTAVAVTTTVAESTTTAAATTTTVAPATTTVPAGVGLSPDGPWHLVDSAPGITTPGLVYELMPKLWAFIQLEETETSRYPWTLNDADRPIIEAYLQAQLTYYTAITSNPINLNLPGWTQFYSDGGAQYRRALGEMIAQNQTIDMDLGVVFQPQILSDERTASHALVADCILDGSVARMPDGSLAEGSSPGVGQHGWLTYLDLLDGAWIVTNQGTVDGGCL
ncbi:MAG TPA: hypothetical protein PK020_11860 [Ilumatobacteraceae bacterium]|nr:hypothetical protein [Ilumatobacteraceae bacterium]